MYVPSSPLEALQAPSPIAGTLAEIYAVASRLQGLHVRCERYANLMETARRQLAENRGAAVETLHTVLSDADEVQLLFERVSVGHSALIAYAGQVSEIHEQARSIEIQARERLETIRLCGIRIEHICEQIGVEVRPTWYDEVPHAMPYPRVERGMDKAQEQMRILELRERHEWDWSSAAARWHETLLWLDALRIRWVDLHERRISAEHRLVTALTLTATVSAVSTGIWRGTGGGTDAVSAIRLEGHETAEAGPAARRDHPLMAGLQRRQLQRAGVEKEPTAREVQEWWFGLTAGQRSRLIVEAPLVVGNLAGVPLESRIRANAVSARYFAAVAGIGATEAEYWERVSNGEISLIVSDPERSRFVEMVGELGSDTERVVTYVPGTGTQPKHFYSGDVQQVARYLSARSQGSTVVFVCKDGPWVSWAGPNANTDYQFLADRGRDLAEFQREVLDREPELQGLSRIAVAHSAGMSVVSGAEIAGAEFDLVVSLGGSFALEEWQPNAATDYHHFQYENDLINRIDAGSLRTPHELKRVFVPHVFDSEGKSELQSHSRIADGTKTNETALKELHRIVKERR